MIYNDKTNTFIKTKKYDIRIHIYIVNIKDIFVFIGNKCIIRNNMVTLSLLKI